LIFLTVGTQLPFDRLVRSVDEWCARHDHHEIFGQIAAQNSESYTPKNFSWQAFLTPEDIEKRFKDARIIVGHAGMGTIISALTHRRPLLMLPRRAEFGEHRNDHQLATADRFGDRPNLNVATDKNDISEHLDRLTGPAATLAPEVITPFAEQGLIAAVRGGLLGRAQS